MQRDIARNDDVQPTPDASSLHDALEKCSRLTWKVDTMWPMQLACFLAVFSSENTKKRMIVVQPRGGGKTHVIRVIGSMLRAITLLIHPLLTLTGDQVGRFLEGSDVYGSMEAHNLDKQGSFNPGFQYKLLKRLRRVQNNTTSTIFLFVSLQYLATNSGVQEELLRCSRRGTLRSVQLDKAHLYAQ